MTCSDLDRSSRPEGDTHYNVGPAGTFGGPILDIVLPDGTKIRRVDEELHRRALQRANETLGRMSASVK